MKLSEAIFNLTDLPDEAVLFAERIDGQFSPESSVVILSLNDEELALPVAEVAASRAPGTDYFLEAFLVRDMVAEWQDTRTADSIGTTLLVDRIIHYAEHDG